MNECIIYTWIHDNSYTLTIKCYPKGLSSIRISEQTWTCGLKTPIALSEYCTFESKLTLDSLTLSEPWSHLLSKTLHLVLSGNDIWSRDGMEWKSHIMIIVTKIIVIYQYYYSFVKTRWKCSERTYALYWKQVLYLINQTTNKTSSSMHFLKQDSILWHFLPYNDRRQ